MDNRRVYELWLSLACTPGNKTFFNLLTKFSSAEEIYEATVKEIRAIVGSKSADYLKLMDKSLDKAQSILDFCTRKGVGILSYFDEEFPENLRDIPNPPVLLYYRGRLPNFKSGFRCAVVGTRDITDYGKKHAFNFGYDIAKAGAIVVSGMAKGIDGVAMAAAMAAGGVTIAFLGSGIDVCYPAVHKTLARAIVKEGCIFTEYPPGSKPEGRHFPVRNRLISGISHATVVVEGRENSGAMSTAGRAKDQGRPLFAFPGDVGHKNSEATNLLIRNGANLCTGADDVVRMFENSVGIALNPHKLPLTREVDMKSVIHEYEVYAPTYSDAYIPFMPKATIENYVTPIIDPNGPIVREELIEEINDPYRSKQFPVDQIPMFEKLDQDALDIYMKIPFRCECEIESLTDEKYNLRAVMKLLLRLEMLGAVAILPGDKVKRIEQ